MMTEVCGTEVVGATIRMMMELGATNSTLSNSVR